MNKIKFFVLTASAVIAMQGTSDARAENVVFTFDIGVTSCSSSTLPSACNSFTPYHFTQTWTLNNYSDSDPTLINFGGGSSMLKAQVFDGRTFVSPEPNAAVLSAAGMLKNDISQSVYFENAAYYTNGVNNGYNVGDLQFRNGATLKPDNGDGSYEYKNYYQNLYFDISGTSFTDVQAMTPDLLAAYLTVGRTSSWGEEGRWEHLGNCCTDEGRFTRNDLYLTGTATVLQVSSVPAPPAFWIMLSGLVGLYGRFWLKKSA